MEENNKGKQVEQETVNGNNKPPLKILTSGKVMGNPVEQWKEVKDNRVKVVNNDKGVQNTTGKK